MADDEDYEQPVGGIKQPAITRPERRIEVRQHDTNKARTEEIIELAQTVLDTLAAGREELQTKIEASQADLGESVDGDVGPFAIASAGASHKDVATALKRKLDETYNGTWHVIVGSSFGGNVTNEENTLLNFVVDGVYFLVLRSGPPDRPETTTNAAQDEEDGAVAAK